MALSLILTIKDSSDSSKDIMLIKDLKNKEDIKFGKKDYIMILKDISFMKKMYEPGIITAYFQFKIDGPSWITIGKDALEAKYKDKEVTLRYGDASQDDDDNWIIKDDFTVCSGYYIHEIHPLYKSDRTIFVSAAPEEVLPLLDSLIYQFNLCAADEECNKLVLIAAFMLDFMCIHPYNHGNGRLSRLILDFLMKKFGYDVDEYFAIAYLMRQHINEYIDAFEASSKGWHDNENDYEAFVEFVLKRVLEAYRKLDYIMEVNAMETTSEEKVLKVVVDSATPINKTVVVNVLYATSQATIEKALAKLLKDGRIQLITKGRYSKYFRV